MYVYNKSTSSLSSCTLLLQAARNVAAHGRVAHERSFSSSEKGGMADLDQSRRWDPVVSEVEQEEQEETQLQQRLIQLDKQIRSIRTALAQPTEGADTAGLLGQWLGLAEEAMGLLEPRSTELTLQHSIATFREARAMARFLGSVSDRRLDLAVEPVVRDLAAAEAIALQEGYDSIAMRCLQSQRTVFLHPLLMFETAGFQDKLISVLKEISVRDRNVASATEFADHLQLKVVGDLTMTKAWAEHVRSTFSPNLAHVQWYSTYWSNYVWMRKNGLGQQEWVDRPCSFDPAEDSIMKESIKDGRPLTMAVVANGLAAEFNSVKTRSRAPTVFAESAELKRCCGGTHHGEACQLANKAVEAALEVDGMAVGELRALQAKLTKFQDTLWKLEFQEAVSIMSQPMQQLDDRIKQRQAEEGAAAETRTETKLKAKPGKMKKGFLL